MLDGNDIQDANIALKICTVVYITFIDSIFGC